MAISEYSKNYYKQSQESLMDSYRKTLEFEARIAPYRVFKKSRLKKINSRLKGIEQEREHYLKDIAQKLKDLQA